MTTQRMFYMTMYTGAQSASNRDWLWYVEELTFSSSFPHGKRLLRFSGYRGTNSNCKKCSAKLSQAVAMRIANIGCTHGRDMILACVSDTVCAICSSLVFCVPLYCKQQTERLTRQYHQRWKCTTVSSFVPSEFFNFSEICCINSRALSLLDS